MTTPPSHRPGRISSAREDKNNGLKPDGDLYVHLFMAGDLNSIVFKSENWVGMEKITLDFVVGIHLFNHFQRGQILEYNFPLGMIYFGQFFQWGGGPTESVRRGCLYEAKTWSLYEHLLRNFHYACMRSMCCINRSSCLSVQNQYW